LWYGICSIYNSAAAFAEMERSSGRDRTADGDKNE
jgi:hypothetical protein